MNAIALLLFLSPTMIWCVSRCWRRYRAHQKFLRSLKQLEETNWDAYRRIAGKLARHSRPSQTVFPEAH